MLLSHQLVMTDAQTHRIADIQQLLGMRLEVQGVDAWVTDESLYSYPWDIYARVCHMHDRRASHEHASQASENCST